MQKLINVMQNCCIYIDDLNYVKANLTIRFTLLTLRQEGIIRTMKEMHGSYYFLRKNTLVVLIEILYRFLRQKSTT